MTRPFRQADNIDAALSGYFRRENLGQGENMYKCEKCHQKVPATKQYKIERPPQVLCVQLKRFNMMGGKNGRPVTLSRKLNVSNHVRWAKQRQIPIEYKLVSMINHVGPSPNCGHYTSIAEGANGTFYRFDDASVSPTSLQNALNTSAYVIFYEMLKTTRHQIMSASGGNSDIKSKSDQSPAAKVPERKVIGPHLPSPSPTIAKVPPSPRTIPSNPGKQSSSQSPLVKPKPKLICESPVLKKPTPAPPKIGGLVPYDGESDSDEEANGKLPSPLPTTKSAITVAKSAAVTSNPFLPRAVNLKKLKHTIQKEDKPSFSINGGSNNPSKNGMSVTNKLEPNRDPSSEILFAKDKIVTKDDVRTVISQSRNEFHVRDIDSHSPSVHSDNSAGSTTSFTVSDIAPGSRPASAASDSYLTTSRQKWNVLPQSNGLEKEDHPNKRERSSPPKSAINKEDTSNEADLQGSPKRRKKTSILENGGHLLLSKAAELGKDILNVGAKLIKGGKMGKEQEDETSCVLESGTACEASTSYSHDRASSSKIPTESEERRHKKKKKKNKHKEDSETWEEKTKDNLDKFTSLPSEENLTNPKIEVEEFSFKKSSFNPDAPVKGWDSKPDVKNIARSVTWDGSKGGLDIGDQLRRSGEIRAWSGDRSSHLERKSLEPRKRSATQDFDAELDAGRVKKVKKWKEEENSKWSDMNPFQVAQEHRNKGHSLDRPDFQRRYA